MSSVYRLRRTVALSIFLIALISLLLAGLLSNSSNNSNATKLNNIQSALSKLTELTIAPKKSKEAYNRNYFGSGWSVTNGCDTRNLILYRDLDDTTINADCLVLSGMLVDPYSGQIINFKRGSSSSDVQIDHVVALSDAWLSGAEYQSQSERILFANDPLELLAVSAKQNQAKLGSDASKWLPPNKAYQCTYVARQIDIKTKYKLTVSETEKDTMRKVLSGCST